MIQKHYPSAIIIPIDDHESDQVWSRSLDKFIRTIAREDDEVTMYCGRDGFKSAYSGKYKVDSIAAVPNYSGTELRVDARRSPLDSVDFRAGGIYALGKRYKVTYMTVDIAVIGAGGILMGRRPNTAKYRFPGGFLGYTDSSLEEAAKRELMEETTLELRDNRRLEYVGTCPIDDWRYRKRPDSRIMTTLFAVRLEDTNGEWQPDGDEFEELSYVEINNIAEVVDEHKSLFMMLSRHLDGNQSGVSEGPKKTRMNKVNA